MGTNSPPSLFFVRPRELRCRRPPNNESKKCNENKKYNENKKCNESNKYNENKKCNENKKYNGNVRQASYRETT